jgi:5-methylcytosine-specific restriction protein A
LPPDQISPKNIPEFDGGPFPVGYTNTMNKICAQAGCKTITTKRNCITCQTKFDIKSKGFAKKRARKSSSEMMDSSRHFYGSVEWKALRTRKIKKDPLCQICLPKGFLREGKDIDHIIEIKDNYSLRLSITNLQTLCRSCHMYKTNKERICRNKKV